MNNYEANLICPATLESVATTAKAQRQLQHELDLNTAMWALWPEPERWNKAVQRILQKNCPGQSTKTINHTSHKLDQERDSILAISLERKHEVLAFNTTSPTPATRRTPRHQLANSHPLDTKVRKRSERSVLLVQACRNIPALKTSSDQSHEKRKLANHP